MPVGDTPEDLNMKEEALKRYQEYAAKDKDVCECGKRCKECGKRILHPYAIPQPYYVHDPYPFRPPTWPPYIIYTTYNT